ncbi:MAG: hypothetical protein JWO38_1755 [Gemmataceae bacterium]|nr:hypothetical protein [Gemmataceae bacterium]
MTPLFACFPVCMTFVSLSIVGAIMILAGAGRDGLPESGGDEQPAPGSPETAGGPPPWWVVVLIFAAVLVGMLLLSLVSGDS